MNSSSPNQIEARFRVVRENFTLDVDLQLPDRGITALFGPSGCGKTTLLRAIAGLERAPGGRLVFSGEPWQDANIFVPPHRRALGYVFQETSLFPHLSVRRNLEYGMRRVPKNERTLHWDEVIDWLGLAPLILQQPHQLSGGQRQRVAIGRALLSSPRLLLMDEPLAALDLKRKQEILPYLERLHDELDIPMLYVSHSPDEVARLADHIVVLADGCALAQGPLAETLARVDVPIHLGEDVGAVLQGTVGERDAAWHLVRVDLPGGALWLRDGGQALGQRLRVRVLARDVSIALGEEAHTSILNTLPAEITAIGDDDHPALALLRLDAGGTPLVARITRRSVHDLNLAPGRRVFARIKAVAAIG